MAWSYRPDYKNKIKSLTCLLVISMGDCSGIRGIQHLKDKENNQCQSCNALMLYESTLDRFFKALDRTCHSCILTSASEASLVMGADVIVAGQAHLPQGAEG